MAKESNIIYELPNAIIFFVLMRVDEPQKLSWVNKLIVEIFLKIHNVGLLTYI